MQFISKVGFEKMRFKQFSQKWESVMRKGMRLSLIASSLLLGSAVGFAWAQEGQPEQASTTEAEQIMQNIDGDHVVASLAGNNLTISELDSYVAIVAPGQADTLGERRLQTLRALVNLRAIAEAAEAKGLGETADFKLRAELMRQSALQEAYINAELVGKVSEEQVKARYEQEISAMSKETEVRARHILVESEEEAQEIIARLDKGEAFEAIAEEKSTDSSSNLGGDIGYFTKGQMVSEFEEAAFALSAGEYTKEPVKSPFGWHVIKVEDVREKAPPTLEDVSAAITNMLMREQYDILTKQAIEKLGVTYTDEAITQFMQKSDDALDEE